MNNESKERPILFNGEMVRAILGGRKRVTRRVVKPQPDPVGSFATSDPLDEGFISWCDIDDLERLTCKNPERHWHTARCPYGRPGDILYVKETWKPGAWREDGRIAIDYRATPEITNTPWVEIPEDYTGKGFDELWLEWTDELLAAGSLPNDEGYHHWEPGKSPLKWRPSIFMPRWASRLTLRVTAVRVERVQEIDNHDSWREGIPSYSNNPNHDYGKLWADAKPRNPERYFQGVYQVEARDVFAELWDSINAKGGYSFESNPFVWVVEFEPCQPGS